MPVFERYWPLVLLALAALPLLLCRPRPWLRLAALVALIAAACGLSLPLARKRAVLMEVVDSSASTPRVPEPGPQESRPSRTTPSSWPDQDHALIEFGRTARIVRPLGAPLAHQGWHQVDATATNVEEGILLAAARAPADAALTVLVRSDGRETHGDARRAIARVRQRGGRVFTAPCAQPLIDTRIVDVSAPTEVAAGEPVAVEVTVAATEPLTTRVSLLADGETLAERDAVEVSPGRDARVAFSLPPLSGPVLALEARISPTVRDALPENDAAWGVIRRAGRPRVLLVAEPGRRLEQVLRASGTFDLRVSTSLEAVTAYDAVVLDDRPIEGMPDLGAYVRDARGGLVVAGGPRSFGPGGYAGTPLEALLPVWCLPQEAFSLVVLLDASGSMTEGTTGATKYDVALLALDAARDLLRPGDRAELARFAGGVDSPGMADAASFSSQIAAARRIPPSGSTALLPALDRGVRDLEKESSARRHLLVITDGELAPSEVGSTAFAAYGERMARIGAACTVLITGTRPAEAELRALGGRYLPLDRLDDLPRRLREDLVQARRLVDATPEAPKRSAGPSLLPGAERCPPVGRNRVTTKEGARADFVYEDGSPLYAGWQAGLGRVLAIATTLEEPWGVAWTGDTAAIWVEAVRWALRPSGQTGVSWQVRGDRLECVVPGPFRSLAARIVPANGAEVVLPLDAVGRERYAAPLPELPAGIGAIEVREGDRVLANGAIALPVGAEFRSIGVDRARLESWAQLGGGRVIEGALPPPPDGGRGAPWPMEAWLAGAAMAILFAEALRRRRAA